MAVVNVAKQSLHSPGSLLRPLILEHGLYGACVMVAVGLRFHDLALAPLGPLEAVSSFSAWSATNGPAGTALAAESPPTSALLFGIQWLLFWLMPGGDFEARLASAAAGSALVLVPWLLRRVIGRSGALALAALLSIDPVLIGVSRTADGAIFSALWSLLLLGCLAQSSHDTPAAGRWRSAAAACVGLLLVSSKETWSLLTLVVVAALLVPRFGPFSALRSEADRGLHSFLATAAVTALGAATTGFVQWQGAGFLAAGLTAWMKQWRFDVNTAASAGGLVLELATAQPLLLVVPLVGFSLAWPRSETRPGLVRGGFLVVGMIVAGIAGGADSVRLTLTLTLAFLAACSVRTIASQWSGPGCRFTAARVVGAVAGAGVLLLAVRAALHVGSPGAVDPGARQLAHDIAALSVWRAGDADAQPIAVVADPWPDPLLAWYLRRHTHLRWILSVPLEVSDSDSAGKPLIITPDVESRNDPLPSWANVPRGYAGTRYRIGRLGAGHRAVVLWVTLR